MLDSAFPSANSWKMRQSHLVPLSAEAIAILKELHTLTGRGKYVFPCNGRRDRAMSEAAIGPPPWILSNCSMVSPVNALPMEGGRGKMLVGWLDNLFGEYISY